MLPDTAKTTVFPDNIGESSLDFLRFLKGLYHRKILKAIAILGKCGIMNPSEKRRLFAFPTCRYSPGKSDRGKVGANALCMIPSEEE